MAWDAERRGFKREWAAAAFEERLPKSVDSPRENDASRRGLRESLNSWPRSLMSHDALHACL